jgi:hypothetical protein
MNPVAAAAALALAVAAPFAAPDRTGQPRRLGETSRVLAAVGAILLLSAAAHPAARTAAVLAIAASVVAPRGLACVMAAAAAVVAAVRPAAFAVTVGFGVWPPVAALALGLAAAATEAVAEKPRSRERAGAWAAASGGAVLVLSLLLVDGGRVLRWSFGLGGATARVELPGAALVLGLALLVSLAGTLAMAAHLLASSTPTSSAARLGRRLLVLGAGLGGLGVAVVAGQGLARSPEALAAGARDLASLLLAAALLVWGLVRLLATPANPPAEAPDVAPRNALGLAAAIGMLAAGAAGWESWWTAGTYATSLSAEAASAALLGLAAVQPSRLGLARAVLFVLGHHVLLARAV